MLTKTLTATPYVINEPFLVVRDAPRAPSPAKVSVADVSVMEQYYNDVYKLLLARLVNFDRASVVTEKDGQTLKALVAELIKVKSLLETKTH